MIIKELFDSKNGIDRAIEKVISYQANAEKRLKSEINEYVATDSIEGHFESLLEKMHLAMEHGGENEVGVWVSGFYGSGKSSFTKYLGLAFDDAVQIEGRPFIEHLKDRLQRNTTKSLLTTVAKRFPAAVVMLDLASEQLAGASMADVATVLYYKVLQWAGYSRNIKVAAFERKLQKDGRYDEFLGIIQERAEGESWKDLQNNELIVDGLLPTVAHQMYPQLFKTDASFSTEQSEIIQFENNRVEEMINIAREHSGKEYIIFVVDEVGQYVGSREGLILNLDGLAKNLKNIGDGKVWLIGTAQQTLTEDSERAALNSAQLFKLKDRFPIQINLESSDIKEICYRRLLGKSTEGESQLGQLFDQHGHGLRHATKLDGARVYESDFDRKSFVNLYPFLPAHFEVLLTLLGQLAKSTGGIGLRSAIKVIQDILVEGINGQPVADRAVGTLANTVTLYDALEKDIKRAFPTKHQAVEKIKQSNLFDKALHLKIGKSVAVLEILTNLPVTRKNVRALMQESVDHVIDENYFDNAVNDLITEAAVPFSEQDGRLMFISEKLTEIQQTRNQIAVKHIELRRQLSETLGQMLRPAPKVKVANELVVETGLKLESLNGIPSSLSGERNPIQTIIHLVAPEEYDSHLDQLISDSREKANENVVYLIGRQAAEVDQHIREICRCKEIDRMYRNEVDSEVKDYCKSQVTRAETQIEPELIRQLNAALMAGSLIFRGKKSATDTFGGTLKESCEKHLKEVAENVYNRFAEAPHRAITNLAEIFLRAGLNGVNSTTDPLNLVLRGSDGKYSIDADHKGLSSLRDSLGRTGSEDAKALCERFSRPPFGWSVDTTRYLIAALYMAGEVSFKIAGQEFSSTVGQKIIEAIKTNNSFAKVGITLRDDRPSTDVCDRAANRLGEIIANGHIILPLEDEISKAAQKELPQLQRDVGPLLTTLKSLRVPGAERIEALSIELSDLLSHDCSGITASMGAEDSNLYANLKWAASVLQHFNNGLDETLRAYRRTEDGLNNLPKSPLLNALKEALAESLQPLNERLKSEHFYDYHSEFSATLGSINTKINYTLVQMKQEHQDSLAQAQQDVTTFAGWEEIRAEERNNLLGRFDQFTLPEMAGLQAIQQMVTQSFEINGTREQLREEIKSLAEERRRQRESDEVPEGNNLGNDAEDGPSVLRKTVTLPTVLSSPSALDDAVNQLQSLQRQVGNYDQVQIRIDVRPWP